MVRSRSRSPRKMTSAPDAHLRPVVVSDSQRIGEVDRGPTDTMTILAGGPATADERADKARRAHRIVDAVRARLCLAAWESPPTSRRPPKLRWRKRHEPAGWGHARERLPPGEGRRERRAVTETRRALAHFNK
ncbi:hypothetical protein AKJ09_04684 [Labilithrix luteola]|uniref:Uncharacterized protein n=1 Tax=Labilithrix luteola TaxID=1391654 RepID=A0A0K1PWW2_9BACT|nr:hypothetical protein AKJ09_04684 [Labilithrix luteola]